MSNQNPQLRLLELIVQTRLDSPSQEDVAELQALLQDPAMRRLYIELVNLEGHLESAHSKETQEANEPADFDDIVLALLRSESASPDVAPLAELPGPVGKPAAQHALTRAETLSAASYVLKHTFTPKRVAVLATAAALLLGMVLAIVLLSGPNEGKQIAETQNQGDPVIEKAIVATLTAEHNAAWSAESAEGASAPGSDLRAGDRLTLTQGFAEITTAAGAVAILEAPATVELMDDSNAIQLHSGKLVGICESPSSKGFVVRTPHMDITDLGTRFGVDASVVHATSVHVLDGEIEVGHTAQAEQQAKQLSAGQALIATASTLAEANYDPKPFAFAFNDLRPRFAGGPMIWQGQASRDLRLHKQEAKALQVFLERRSVLLESDIPVDLIPGESWPSQGRLDKAVATSGSRADVYLLHLDPLGQANDNQVSIRGEIHFDRPVIGLIATQSMLRNTDAILGFQGADYGKFNTSENTSGAAGLDTAPYEDKVSLSEDGRTLTLDLSAAMGFDQVRVLVQSKDRTQHDLEQP